MKWWLCSPAHTVCVTTSLLPGVWHVLFKATFWSLGVRHCLLVPNKVQFWLNKSLTLICVFVFRLYNNHITDVGAKLVAQIIEECSKLRVVKYVSNCSKIKWHSYDNYICIISMSLSYVPWIDVDITLFSGLVKTRSPVLVGSVWPEQFRRALLYLMWGKTSLL